MNRKTAGLAFLGVCIVLAGLLLTGTISTVTGTFVFAVALATFGLASRGFRRS